MKISVIICTHNPRMAYLSRVLDALKSQKMPRAEWELLVVDNASAEPVHSSWDLTWHPLARHIAESKLGLTAARLRGIHESAGDLILFLDDDNVLEAEYLQQAVELSNKHPHLGAWGGSAVPDFELPPPPHLEKYLNRLALSKVARDRWSNSYVDFEAIPYGAGLIVRRAVAEKYAENVASSELRKGLDRTGKSLASCGDIDFVWTAIDLNLSVGRFTSLSLTHIIPPNRLKSEYLLALIEADASSRILLDEVRGFKTFPVEAKPRFLKSLRARVRLSAFDYSAWRATIAGAAKARNLLAES